MYKTFKNILLIIVSVPLLVHGSQLSVATQVAAKEAKEKCSEEQELVQAYGAIEIARLADCVLTIGAFKGDGSILALGDTRGTVHCYDRRADCWSKQALFGVPITTLAVGKTHIAAAQGTVLKMFEINDSLSQQEFDLSCPLISLVAQPGNESFVALDAEGNITTFLYISQTMTHVPSDWMRIRLGADSSAQLNMRGTVCVVRTGKHASLVPLQEKKTAARALEARAKIDALGVSPDGSMIVTAVGTALTAWRASGCPYSWTLSQTPSELVVDTSNRFILCAQQGWEALQLYDVQKGQFSRLAESERVITNAMFIPSDPNYYILVSRLHTDKQEKRNGLGGSLITLHPTDADIKLSSEQRGVLLAIAREKKEKGDMYVGYALPEAERKVLATTSSWIKQVLARTYKVKL